MKALKFSILGRTLKVCQQGRQRQVRMQKAVEWSSNSGTNKNDVRDNISETRVVVETVILY